MRQIRLLVTDLDGTLVGPTNEYFFYQTFGKALARFRKMSGASWVICTGRSKGGFDRAFFPLSDCGIRPDYIILKHAYIFTVWKGRYYIPHWFWNLGIYLHGIRQTHATQKMIRELYRRVKRMFPRSRTVRLERERFCLRFEDIAAANNAAAFLREVTLPYPMLRIFEYLLEVDVRSIPLAKGVSIQEVARHLGVPPDDILAIGDGYNDLSMMAPDIVKLTACPSNAAADVVEAVHRSGGHIARNPTLAGMIEILEAYMSDTVNSGYPDGWDHAPLNPNAPSTRTTRHEEYSIAGLILFLFSVYAGLFVFSHFGLLPPLLSRLVLAPYDIFMSVLEKLARMI